MGAAVVCTGCSDCPNLVNNVLVFPGLFRGELDADHILPSNFDEPVRPTVSAAVVQAAREDGVSRLQA